MAKRNYTVRLSELWIKLTPELRRRFAMVCKAAPGSMRQYAEGRRSISAAVAVRIEKGTVALGEKMINRMELNETCRKCEYAIRCNPKLAATLNTKLKGR